MDQERVLALNPKEGAQGTNILRSMYDPVKAAILAAIGEHGELAFSDLRAEVEARTPASMWESASVGWYTTTVKLDLEARGLIERVPRSSPQLLRLGG
ncbi:MAG: hypothetical protein QNJ81_06060 [Acidimicrobiia bacterium]|nr:hypothetical protein [Acidimicrobiia bacterium]